MSHVKFKLSEQKEFAVSDAVLTEAKYMLSDFYKKQKIESVGDKNELRKYVARAAGLTEDFKLGSSVGEFEVR